MDKYKIKNFISKGRYGNVYSGVQTDLKRKNQKRKVAIKSQPENTDQIHEIEILQSLDHPYVIKLIDSYVNNKRLYIVLEYIKGYDLFDLIYKTKISFNRRTILKKIAIGLSYIHQQNIIHRDIKLENVLYDTKNQTIKICDFGCSIGLDFDDPNKRDLLKEDVCGTPEYISPEMIFQQGYDHRTDIWSFGVLFYELNYMKLPFDPDEELFMRVKLLDYTFPFEKLDSQNLIRKILVYENDRIDLTEILNHVYFK